jgi:hypothetical protein
MKKIILSLVVIVVLGSLCIGAYPPAPTIPPDGVAYDIVQAPNAMGVYTGYTGKARTGFFDVYASSNRTISLVDTGGMVIGIPVITTDVNDVKKYVYSWSFTPVVKGITYHNIKVEDNLGGSDVRQIVIEAKNDVSVVIGGCRVN